MSQVRAGAVASAFLQLSVQFSVRKERNKCAAAPFRLPLQVRARCGCNKRLTARPDLPELTAKAYEVAQITESD